MSRRSDLEANIRDSYELIREYEAIIRTSSDPKEIARSRRFIGEQWELIKDYLAKYVPLCKSLGLGAPEDITEIAAHFPEYDSSRNGLERPRGSDRPAIAIDVRHGARIGRPFIRELEVHGFRVKELETQLTASSLSNVSVLILFTSFPDQVRQPLTPEEIVAIHSFVMYGGGLFLVGLGWVWQDYGSKMDDYPLNQISHCQFKIYFRGAYLDDPKSEFEMIGGYPCTKFDSTNMRKHPVTAGVSSIFSFGMSSTLEVALPAVPLVWDGDDENRCVLAAWHVPGQGRVICLQHEGYFKDENIYEYDNLELLMNSMQWLSQSGEMSRDNHFERVLPVWPPLTSLSSTFVAPKDSFVHAHALLIGIGDYIHPRLASLPATVRDAQAIIAVLTDPARCGYLSANVHMLTGEQATAPNIREALEVLAKSTLPESTVLVYFSGHGGRALEDGVWRAYLCPREANPDDLAQTAIPGDEFSDLLATISARKLLVMLDACHAGGSADLKAADGSTVWKAGLSEDYYEVLSQGSGRVVIASSKEDQFSYVRGELSLFTNHLVQALNGKAAVRSDGLIHVLDVFHYVNEAVQADEPKQVPILKVKDLDLNFPIALDRGGKGVGPAIAPPSSWVQLKTRLMDVTKREAESVLSQLEEFPYMERSQLRRQFDGFLQSDKRLLIVVGASGTGKSTFFARLANEYQECEHIAFLMYTAGSYSSGAFRESINIDGVLGHALSSLKSEGSHAGEGFLSTVKELFHREHQRVIIVFDAINESFEETRRVSHPKRLLERISHFVKEIDDMRIKVVATTRPGVWDIIREPIKHVEYRCFPNSKHPWIDLGNWEPSEASEAYEQYRSWYHVATVYSDLSLRWREFIQNPLNLHVLCQVSGKEPEVSSPRDLYRRHLLFLVEEGILEKDAPPFIERELIRLMIPDNLAEPFTNAVDKFNLDERQGQLARSLVDAGVLTEFVGAYGAGSPRYLYRFRFERYFDHLGGYRIHSLLSSLDDSDLMNSALGLANSLDRYPFMWGALQEALALTLEESRQSALSTLCLQGHVVLTEMFITFLKEIGLSDRDTVCQFNESIWENRRRVQGKAERHQVERLCVEIAARFFQEDLLVKIAAGSILPRSYVADQIYLLWRTDAEGGRTEKGENRGLRILDRTLSEIRWFRPRLLPSLLITSALVTAAVYLWEHEATGALLQRMWRPVFRRLRYLIPLIPLVGPPVVLLLARRREYESSANFQEIGAFFKLSKDQKAYVRRLVPFLHPEEHTLQEAKSAVLEICDYAVNPPAAFFVQKILEIHGVRGQRGLAVDLAREIFERDLRRAHPTVCAMCMHSVCWDLIRVSEEVSDHSFGALRDMTVSFFREVKDFRYDGAAGSYHPLLMVRYAVSRAKKTGRIEIDLADEFIQTMLKRDLTQPVRDYIHEFGALALRGQEELALEGAKYVVDVDDSVVQERLGQLLARVGARYPGLAKDFIQEQIPSNKQRAFETRMKAAKVQRAEGDILASVEITVVDALRNPALWKLMVWGVDQMMKCQNLFQWMTIVARHAVELVLGEETKGNE